MNPLLSMLVGGAGLTPEEAILRLQQQAVPTLNPQQIAEQNEWSRQQGLTNPALEAVVAQAQRGLQRAQGNPLLDRFGPAQPRVTPGPMQAEQADAERLAQMGQANQSREDMRLAHRRELAQMFGIREDDPNLFLLDNPEVVQKLTQRSFTWGDVTGERQQNLDESKMARSRIRQTQSARSAMDPTLLPSGASDQDIAGIAADKSRMMGYANRMAASPNQRQSGVGNALLAKFGMTSQQPQVTALDLMKKYQQAFLSLPVQARQAAKPIMERAFLMELQGLQQQQQQQGQQTFVAGEAEKDRQSQASNRKSQAWSTAYSTAISKGYNPSDAQRIADATAPSGRPDLSGIKSPESSLITRDREKMQKSEEVAKDAALSKLASTNLGAAVHQLNQSRIPPKQAAQKLRDAGVTAEQFKKYVSQFTGTKGMSYYLQDLMKEMGVTHEPGFGAKLKSMTGFREPRTYTRERPQWK